MITTASPGTRGVLLLGSAMAVVAGLVYLAIAGGMVADDFQSPPRPLMAIAGAIYLGGAGVMHFVNRRLLLVGAVLNGVVLVLFLLSAARDNATVDALSLAGKAAQVALGVALVLAWRKGGEPGAPVRTARA